MIVASYSIVAHPITVANVEEHIYLLTRRYVIMNGAGLGSN
jgi:hypothetical protein